MQARIPQELGRPCCLHVQSTGRDRLTNPGERGVPTDLARD